MRAETIEVINMNHIIPKECWASEYTESEHFKEIWDFINSTLKEVIGDIEPEGSNYYASNRNSLRRKQYEKARELGFDVRPQEKAK